MTKSETAEQLFTGGFNCATSVLLTMCEEYDLDAQTAAKLACGLGGGCGDGEVCGAVSAAVLVVGLKYGQSIPNDLGTKANCYAKTAQFIDAFKQKHGKVACRDLLAGISTANDEEYADERRRLCTGFVKSAVEILDELEY